VPHFKYISILFLLAVVATGTKRLSLALALTMLVGVAWELAQTTVIGHNARVADLAPNVVAGVGCFIVVWFLRFVMLSPKRRRILSEEAAQQSDAADEVRAGHGNRGPRS
jgi:VanZ family protein